MYAVIKTGGKQYRVRPGDLLVIEKLAGEPGEAIAFDQVLMLGEGDAVTVGVPTIEGASVGGTLVETRKGEKVKIFKKKRRQGYRRTRGHRQPETVVRVTSIAGAGQTETWDGEVDLTPKSVLNLRARNLVRKPGSDVTPEGVDVETLAAPQGEGKAANVRGSVVEHADAVASETAPKKTAGKKAAAADSSAPKAPTGKALAKAATPKMTKAQVKSPAVRKTAPRGNKG